MAMATTKVPATVPPPKRMEQYFDIPLLLGGDWNHGIL